MPTPKQYSQQLLKQINIKKLKNLIDIEIDLSEKPLIAILGPNGSGKSTILHALSCVYNPVRKGDALSLNYRFSEFFTPTTNSTWIGSQFSIKHNYSYNDVLVENKESLFSKAKSRWTPRYSSRIIRYVSYIGIKTCVPKIELETQVGRIAFNTTSLEDNISRKVKEKASYIMNRRYDSYNIHKSRGKKQYIGVNVGELKYSSLSMGAGEQRLFYILGEIYKAPKYSLILIDEIDLLLHQDALNKLLREINKIALNKSLQIIFTTHSHYILNLDFIAHIHIYQTPEKTLCFNQTNPEVLKRLTGEQKRPIEIFVEDDLAEILIRKICSEENIEKMVSIYKFGSCENCFTAVCGAILNNLENLDNMLYVLDGDNYISEEDKKGKIKKFITGTETDIEIKRELALSHISQFNIEHGKNPEQYYINLILNVDDSTIGYSEIINCAKNLCVVNDSHEYFDSIIEEIGCKREVGLTKLIEIVALSSEWDNISSNIREWIRSKKIDLNIQQ